ncbi:hypothetical protein HYH03_014618 [Edaphochlamys debaryana]|uniref:Pherophorin domain-containing protein n=1 Tax=Edaphochlamys debaryana TaxID=47281 RepID=A0A835XNB6_9CHLO|nr:hypothetical protein HYH03_014618 [Edaphochlamys debaryana]|eukprot:KAG2486689.1 hypothetical protein HYH03_014618 [Edaphochlamys debaryana]
MPPLRRAPPPSRRSSPPPPPPVYKCKTCFQLEVVGPDNTPETTTWDFLGAKSCAEEGFYPIPPSSGPLPTCCERARMYLADTLALDADYGLDPDLDVDLTGFEELTCTKTSIRICGDVTAPHAGEALKAYLEQSLSLSTWTTNMVTALSAGFGNSGGTCPMAMIGSSARVVTVDPLSGEPDAACLPFDVDAQASCAQPSLAFLKEIRDVSPFPNDTCASAPGSTPFALERYMVVVEEDAEYHLACMAITPNTPKDAASACASADSLDKVAVLLWDDEDFGTASYLQEGVLLRQKDAEGGYVTKDLTVSTGPPGSNSFYLSGLGLTTADLASEPAVCFRYPADSDPIWLYYPVDPLGNLWTALYDASGKCCPTYYANRF